MLKCILIFFLFTSLVLASEHRHCSPRDTSYQLCRHNSKCSQRFYLELATRHWNKENTHIVSTPPGNVDEKKSFDFLFGIFLQNNTVPAYFLSRDSGLLCKPAFHNHPSPFLGDDDDDGPLPEYCNVTTALCSNITSISNFQWLWLKYMQTFSFCEENARFLYGQGCQCLPDKICNKDELRNTETVMKFSGILLAVIVATAGYILYKSVKKLLKQQSIIVQLKNMLLPFLNAQIAKQ